MNFNRRQQWARKALAALMLSFALSPVLPVRAETQDLPITAVPAIAAAAVSAEPASVSDTGDSAVSAVPGQVLIKYKEEADSRNFGAAKAVPIAGTDYKKLAYAPGTDLDETIDRLEDDPAVAYAEPVYRIAATDDAEVVSQAVYNDRSNPTYMRSWGQQATGLAAARDTYGTGSRAVKVAVIDTGVDLDHPDLAGSLLPGKNFVSGELGTPPQDRNGHGTHVAGIIAAQAHDGTGYTGIAPGVSIVPVKILDDQGNGDTSGLVSGIEYAVQQGVDIINFSLGAAGDSRAVHDAVKRAAAKGILVVAAAGNESNHWVAGEAGNLDANAQARSYMPTDYPAAYPEVVSVSALEQLADGSLTIADFSNVGKVDVAAPGVNIYSTYPEDPSVPNDGYAVLHGTSQATPFVSGFAALLKSRNPSLTGERLRTLIEDSASPLPIAHLAYASGTGAEPQSASDYFGSGMLAAQKAFAQPRLTLSAAVESSQSGKAVVTVTAEDANGRVTAANGPVSVEIWRVTETEPQGAYTTQKMTETPLTLTGGTGTAEIDVPESGVYHYLLYANAFAGGGLLRSAAGELAQRPEPPIASLASGSYSGAKQVRATVPDGDSVYYRFTGDSGASAGEGVISSPLTVSESGVLLLYAYRNGVFSEPVSYRYTIGSGSTAGTNVSQPQQPVTVPAPAPAPVVVSPAPIATPTPPPAPAAPVQTPAAAVPEKPVKTVEPGSGGAVVRVKPDADALRSQLKNGGTAAIDATSGIAGSGIGKVEVSLPGDALALAAQSGASILLKADDFTLTLPPGAAADNGTATGITLTASRLGASGLSAPAAGKAAAMSPVYDFKLTADSRSIDRFASPVKAVFTLLGSYNADKVGVFYYDEAKRSWLYAGGKVSGGTIAATLSHFSQYGVFEVDKTFADISNHWARPAIESLAAKSIVTGLTETKFGPSASVNRAQFASLLTRSLRLEPAAGSLLPFRDVNAGAWYYGEVLAAFRAGIAGGTDAAHFAPDGKLSREQMAAMLVKAYLSAAGKKLDAIGVSGAGVYRDDTSISGWAKPYVRAAGALGLMNGVSGGRFDPAGQTTRAQAAVAIQALLKQLP